MYLLIFDQTVALCNQLQYQKLQKLKLINNMVTRLTVSTMHQLKVFHWGLCYSSMKVKHISLTVCVMIKSLQNVWLDRIHYIPSDHWGCLLTNISKSSILLTLYLSSSDSDSYMYKLLIPPKQNAQHYQHTHSYLCMCLHKQCRH